MKKLVPITSILIVILGASVANAQGPSYFIQTSDIQGGSEHSTWGSPWSEAHSVSGNFSENECGPIMVEKPLDKASVHYMSLAFNGSVKASVQILGVSHNSSGVEVEDALIYIENAKILNVETSGDEGSPMTETLSIIGSPIQVTYYDNGGGAIVSILNCPTKRR